MAALAELPWALFPLRRESAGVDLALVFRSAEIGARLPDLLSAWLAAGWAAQALPVFGAPGRGVWSVGLSLASPLMMGGTAGDCRLPWALWAAAASCLGGPRPGDRVTEERAWVTLRGTTAPGKPAQGISMYWRGRVEGLRPADETAGLSLTLEALGWRTLWEDGAGTDWGRRPSAWSPGVLSPLGQALLLSGAQVAIDGAPAVLRGLPQWMVWTFLPGASGKKSRKYPLQPSLAPYGRAAKSNDPTTWGAFEAAVETLRLRPWLLVADSARTGSTSSGAEGNERPTFVRRRLMGLSFALRRGDGLVGVDLDGCVVDGEVSPWARRITEALPGYWEYSPSGKGLRGFFLKPDDWPVPRPRVGPGVEIYDYRSPRLLTVTGHRLAAQDVGWADAAGWERLAALYPAAFAGASPGSSPGASRGVLRGSALTDGARNPAVSGSAVSGSSASGIAPACWRGLAARRRLAFPPRLTAWAALKLSPEAVLEAIASGPDGANFAYYFQRHDMDGGGSLSAAAGSRRSFGDWSLGDARMARLLSAYTLDPWCMDAIFRRSRRYRDKWERVMSRVTGETYAEYVIGYALGLQERRLGPGFLRQGGSDCPGTSGFRVSPPFSSFSPQP